MRPIVIAFSLIALILSVRTAELSLLNDDWRSIAGASIKDPTARFDIVDRNGVTLATSLPTVSVYGIGKNFSPKDGAGARIASILSGVDSSVLQSKIDTKEGFFWIKRNATAVEQAALLRLGEPGVDFHQSATRIYPHGSLAAHALGFTDVDGRGISGAEKFFDGRISDWEKLHLSLDIRIQADLRSALEFATAEFSALGGAGIVLDARTSEVLALVSLPDYDANERSSITSGSDAMFNRVTKGVYEFGSTFKPLTAAIALDSGTITANDGYDATHPLRIGRFTISDNHATRRWLSVEEILIHSSNIGIAKMAIDIGTKTQRRYLGQLGLLSPPQIELPEIGRPLTPGTWREINTMTIGYGHGIAVTLLQLANSYATLVNGGLHRQSTIVRDAWRNREVVRVFKPETSAALREMLENMVEKGAGRNSHVPGIGIGGASGTAAKAQSFGGYVQNKVLATYVAAYPISNPRYVVAISLDEPNGTKETYGYSTAGWTVAPIVQQVIRRLFSFLGDL